MKRIFLEIKNGLAEQSFIVGLDEQGIPYFEGRLPASIAYEYGKMILDMKTMDSNSETLILLNFDPKSNSIN